MLALRRSGQPVRSEAEARRRDRSSSSSGACASTRSGCSCCSPSSSRSASSSSASAPARPGSATRSRTSSASATAAARRSRACRSKAAKHPNDPTAWRNLATTLEQKQRTQDAVSALERYTTLRPKDQDALAELASQYGTLATNYSNDYAAAQQQMAEQESPASAFGPPSTTPFGKALASPTALKDPISAAIATLAQREADDRLLELPGRTAQRRERLPAAREPQPDGTRPRRSSSARRPRRPRTRRRRSRPYTAFLKLAPTDPLAPQVRQALKALKAQAAAAASSTASG